jgi:ribosome-associated translation inhibitor RaiA
MVRKLLVAKGHQQGANMPPTRIAYHGIEPSDALSRLIQERAEQLDRLGRRIHAVRVLVDAPHHHQRHGHAYRVHIELTTPGHDIVVRHAGEDGSSDEDAYQAVRRAFDAVRRRLSATHARTRGRRRRGDATAIRQSVR